MAKPMIVVYLLLALSFVWMLPGPPKAMYYCNNKGGKYYHLDAQCRMVAPEYLPLSGFPAASLYDLPYSRLNPCYLCVEGVDGR